VRFVDDLGVVHEPGIRLQVSGIGIAADRHPAGDACLPLPSSGLYPDADAMSEKRIEFM